MSHLVSGADGDADAAGDFVATVTDEDAADAEGVADFDGAVAHLSQDEVALAFDVGDVQFLEADVEEFAGGEDFADVAFDVLGVANGGAGGEDGERIDRVGALGFLEPGDVGGLGEEAADAESGHAVNLRERAGNEEVGVFLEHPEGGDAAELVVGFVDENGGVGGAFQDADDAFVVDAGAGGVIRIGDENGLGFGADGSEEFGDGKGEGAEAVGDFADRGASDFGVELVHGVGRFQDQDVVIVVDIGIDEDLDGFVSAVREGEFVFADAEEGGQFAASGAVFRVDGEVVFDEVFDEELGDFLRTADGVFVEIEPEFVASAAGGRMIGRHFFYGGAGAQFGAIWHSSPPRSGHALRALRLGRGWLWWASAS